MCAQDYDQCTSSLVLFLTPIIIIRRRKIRKMERYKAPGSDQIPAELIQAGGEHCILRYINLLC
jgi:hypothetical protein